MSETRIRALYETRLQTFADANDFKVAFENSKADPTKLANSDGVYLTAFLLPADTGSEDLAGDHNGHVGVFQINVNTKVGVGPGIAYRTADLLRASFTNNLRLTNADDGFVVQIVSPLSIGPGIKGASVYTVPTSFRYRADDI